MEIHALHISVTEDDINSMLAKELAKHQMVKNTRLRVQPEGLKLTGVLHVLFDVAFDSTWMLTVDEGKLVAQLTQLTAAGLSANMLKTTLLRFVAEAARKHDGVHIQGDMIIVDVDRAVARNGFSAKVNLQAVIAADGVIVIEAGQLG